MLVGLAGVLYSMVVWWRDVLREANQGDHTPVVQLHHRYGMILFIASEVMFFVAWFWAYFDASLYPGEAIQASRTALTGGTWPPEGIETFDPWHLPLINTLILLCSGCAATWAHHALVHENNNRASIKQGLILAIGLLIAPGAIAFLVVRKFSTMLWVSIIVCMASMLLGTYASFFLDSAPAPTIILIMTALFIVAFTRRQTITRRTSVQRVDEVHSS